MPYPLCAVVGCHNYPNSECKRTISFHKLPLRNPKLLADWTRQLGRSVPVTALICSDHFDDDQFHPANKISQRRLLKRNAVPTIFRPVKRHQTGEGILSRLYYVFIIYPDS